MQWWRPDVFPTQRIWGYETPDGSFAQFTRSKPAVDAAPQAPDMGRERLLHADIGTAYRMLFGHEPHDLKPGQNVLVWGASGGLGSYAIQLINTAGANAIGVISDESKRDFVMGLGAKGVLNRKDFDCWGQMPTVNTPEYATWFKEARKFGKAIWEITGKGVNVDMVFEHPGESTFPVSTFVCKKGGMVVICAGHHRVQSDVRCALYVDAPEAFAREPLRALASRLLLRTTLWLSAGLTLACPKFLHGTSSRSAHEDAAQRA